MGPSLQNTMSERANLSLLRGSRVCSPGPTRALSQARETEKFPAGGTRGHAKTIWTGDGQSPNVFDARVIPLAEPLPLPFILVAKEIEPLACLGTSPGIEPRLIQAANQTRPLRRLRNRRHPLSAKNNFAL
ncbi:hypothetical protein MRX96_043211 [Rhipicephalus microplus]